MVDFERVGDTVGLLVNGRVVGIGERDRVLDGLRVRETDLVLVTETVPDFVRRLEGRTVITAERERVKGRVVGIGERERVLDGLRVRETDLVLVTEVVPDFVGRLEGRIVVAAVLVIDIVPDFVVKLEGRTVMTADRERVKGRVVGIGERDRVLDGLRVRETERVLVTETVPDFVVKLEARTVMTADRERVKGRVVGIAVRERVTVTDRVIETDRVLVTETVTDRVDARVVGIGERDRVSVTDRVIETDRVLLTDTVPERVPTFVVGIGERVNDLIGDGVRESDFVLVTESVGVLVATFVVGIGVTEPLMLLVRETVTEVVTERVNGKLVAATERVSVTVTEVEYVGVAE